MVSSINHPLEEKKSVSPTSYEMHEKEYLVKNLSEFCLNALHQISICNQHALSNMSSKHKERIKIELEGLLGNLHMIYSVYIRNPVLELQLLQTLTEKMQNEEVKKAIQEFYPEYSQEFLGLQGVFFGLSNKNK